jgi:hypothetical protein
MLKGASLQVARSDWTVARVLLKMDNKKTKRQQKNKNGCLACLPHCYLRQLTVEAASRSVLVMCVHGLTKTANKKYILTLLILMSGMDTE